MATGIILGGTAGNNSLSGTVNNDSIYGNGGADTLYGLDGDDTVASGEVYNASTGRNDPDLVGDVLDGGAGNDTLVGGHGNDRMYGGAGNDMLNGGHGVDYAYLDVTRASATITLNGGIRTVQSSLGTDTLANMDRIIFSDVALAWDIDGNGGIIYRLYQAAFDRTPDAEGLGFWIDAYDRGLASLVSISGQFAQSPEFAQKYGTNVSNDAYVTALYANALNRTPDAEGYAYWMDALDRGVATREQLMIDFSESAENKAQVLASIQNGFTYDPWG
jgi:Ca2+-binding RTX toxin-like protein